MSNFVLVSVQVLTSLNHLCNVQELFLLKKQVYFYCRLRILVHLISLFDSAARILRPNLRLGAGAYIGFILSIFICTPLLWLELSSSILVFTTYVCQIFHKSPNSLLGKKLCSCTHILCTAQICILLSVPLTYSQVFALCAHIFCLCGQELARVCFWTIPRMV